MGMHGQLSILVVHFLGFILIAGATVGAWVADGALFKRLPGDRAGAAAIAATLRSYGLAAQIGAGVMLLSGIGLLAHGKWAHWGALWLTIKLGLFVALGMFGGIVGGRSGRKLGALLAAAAAPGGTLDEEELARLRGTRMAFHYIETVLFIAVVALAIFKIT